MPLPALGALIPLVPKIAALAGAGKLLGGIFGGDKTTTPSVTPAAAQPAKQDYTPFLIGGGFLLVIVVLLFGFKK